MPKAESRRRGGVSLLLILIAVSLLASASAFAAPRVVLGELYSADN